MATFELTVEVSYTYEVEADDYAAAEKQGWEYEDYKYTGQVENIVVHEIEEEEEEVEV